MRNNFPALPKKGKKTLSRHGRAEYYRFVLTCTDVGFAFKVYVGLTQASISTKKPEKHCHCVQLPKPEGSQLKRACCRQILWWGDIKQVPWNDLSYSAIKTDVPLLGQTSATDCPRSAQGTHQMSNTEIQHSANSCMCLSAARKITLEKKGRHCEGKEENTGKVTEGEASYHYFCWKLWSFTQDDHILLYTPYWNKHFSL